MSTLQLRLFVAVGVGFSVFSFIFFLSVSNALCFLFSICLFLCLSVCLSFGCDVRDRNDVTIWQICNDLCGGVIVCVSESPSRGLPTSPNQGASQPASHSVSQSATQPPPKNPRLATPPIWHVTHQLGSQGNTHWKKFDVKLF